MNGLIVEDLSSGYTDIPIIHSCTFSAKRGETFVLMGPSGHGKTTLLLTILGILSPMKGKIVLDGQDITQIPIEKRNIGYLPQDYGLFPHLTVEQNIAFGLRVRGATSHECSEAVQKMLDLVQLKGLEKRSVLELSGGQKQRVGLARALAVDPRLLLLDEPLSNIDQITKDEVARHLLELFRSLQIPIIFVTHNKEDALMLGEKVAILLDGTIEQHGSLQEVMNYPKSDLIRRLVCPLTSPVARV